MGTDPEIRLHMERVISLIITEEKPPLEAFWLGFSDGGKFAGALIVHANDFLESLVRASLLNVSPQSDCRGLPIAANLAKEIPDHWKNRLLTEDECEQLTHEVRQILKVLAARV
jgi:hypothetical protein